jgi:hypothetical protein
LPAVFPAPFVETCAGARQPVVKKDVSLRNLNLRAPGTNLELVVSNSAGKT